MINIKAIVDEIKAAKGRRTIVVYHDNCSDGWTAAWAMHRALGPATGLVPAQHGSFNPNLLQGDYLVIADFAFNLATLLDLQRRFKQVLVLDHHKTHEKDLAEFGSAIYDVNRSGAGIVWDTFSNAARPRLIEYVEDRDLWKRELPSCDEIACVVESTDRRLDSWDWLHHNLEHEFETQLVRGRAIQDFKAAAMKEILQRARIVSIGGYEVPSVNANRCFASELGNLLAEGHPFAAVWAQGSKGRFSYSLRSRNPNVDCSIIAAKYGGGGHKSSAAFISDFILD